MILFSFDYPPLDGGISRLCSETAARMRQRGIQVTVVTQRLRGIASDSHETHRVSSCRPLRELLALIRLIQLHKQDNAILCGVWYPEGLLSILAGFQNVSILGHGNELMEYRFGWRRLVWRALRRWVLERASCVIANSSYTARLVAEAAPHAAVHALPLAVDHVRFQPGSREEARWRLGLAPDRFIIGTISRLVRYKGHETVFRAIAELPPELRGRVGYVVAGRGPDEEYLRSKAEDLGIGSSVHWKGFLDEALLPSFYQALDLFALCTQEDRSAGCVEGFGMALLEAQACGIPVVATKTGGMPDAVAEGCGFFIGEDDHSSLAGLVRDFMAGKVRGPSIGVVARKRVETYCTWDRYISTMTAILRKEKVLRTHAE